MFFSLLQVAGILVHLARLTLLKITRDIKLNNDLSPSHLVKAKQLVNDSIRYCLLAPLQALEVLGLLEAVRKRKQEPGLVLLLRLPWEHMKHGYFKIAAVRISDTCRLFIWPNKQLIGVRYATLRLHFKNNFEKSDYEQAEQALRKCISLYNEPRTRSVVSKYLRQQYARCLSSLMLIIQHDPDISNTPRMQDLLGEAQQIMKELGEEKNMK
uniref:Uncharacterized protein n=1 Tax=Avena sativa TaxID=4498 RepID=A0ACD6AA45_AVESA